LVLTLQHASAVSSSAALHRSTLIFGKSAPDASILSRLKRPGKALLANAATIADFLSFFDLSDRRTGISNRKEELRIFFATG
jgi:hypothetical protein